MVYSNCHCSSALCWTEARKYYEADDRSKTEGTGNAENIKLKGLHRLVINNYLLMTSFIRCHKYH